MASPMNVGRLGAASSLVACKPRPPLALIAGRAGCIKSRSRERRLEPGPPSSPAGPPHFRLASCAPHYTPTRASRTPPSSRKEETKLRRRLRGCTRRPSTRKLRLDRLARNHLACGRARPDRRKSRAGSMSFARLARLACAGPMRCGRVPQSGSWVPRKQSCFSSVSVGLALGQLASTRLAALPDHLETVAWESKSKSSVGKI